MCMGAYVEECAGPLGILGLVSGVATMADCEVVEESSRPGCPSRLPKHNDTVT